MPPLDLIRLEARKELARRNFYDYCQFRYPKHYASDRLFLRDLCDRLQAFMEQNTKRFMVVNLPPRHYKSFTATNFVEWLFGQKPTLKVMSGSYNETLSTTFARKVRNTIDERPVQGGQTIYGDLFPATRVKYGQASASLWALDGSGQDSYLATSPGGTATGFGANLVLVDDIIKNVEEAYNELVLDKNWDWFTNTMMQRLEGDDWKVIIIMTRWAEGDLAGRVLASYDDVELITYRAVQPDGSMLCSTILDRHGFDLKTQEMNEDIIEANYNQKPIDVAGRLYGDFPVYDSLPGKDLKKWNYTDTADKGTDFLCSVDYVVHDGDVYLTDVICTDENMEITEPKVAEMLDVDGVHEAIFESNNGGTGYKRNVERLLKERGAGRIVLRDEPQTSNKEARILASSAWCNAHIFMPPNWKRRWPEFYRQLFKYQKKGKNKHDDAPDVLAAIYERVANPSSGFRVRTA